jgi:hypothetical protein
MRPRRSPRMPRRRCRHPSPSPSHDSSLATALQRRRRDLLARRNQSRSRSGRTGIQSVATGCGCLRERRVVTGPVTTRPLRRLRRRAGVAGTAIPAPTSSRTARPPNPNQTSRSPSTSRVGARAHAIRRSTATTARATLRRRTGPRRRRHLLALPRRPLHHRPTLHRHLPRDRHHRKWLRRRRRPSRHPGTAAGTHRRTAGKTQGTARAPVVSRSPTCWRGCRCSHPEGAGVVDVRTELGASSHWALPVYRLQF